MQRILVVVPLAKGAHRQAAELIREGPPVDPHELGLEYHGVYLSSSEVVFAVEGVRAEQAIRAFLNDPARAAALARWAPLLAGAPRIAHERYAWRRRRAA